MKRTLIAASLLLALPCQADDAARVFDSVRASVVTIATRDEHRQIDSEGSGVVIGPATVITNCHVIQLATEIEVTVAGKPMAAEPALQDGERDLCQLRVAGLAAPAAVLRGYQALKPGEPVFAVGNPLGLGVSVSAGIVSLLDARNGQIFTSAPISPGSSGGGLFDAEGRLVGITTRQYGGAQNLNVAIPADWIAELARRGRKPVAAPSPRGADPDWPAEAEALRASSDWPQLLELARRWRQAYPTSAEACALQGLALYELKRYGEARQALQAGLAANSLHEKSYSYLGLVQRAEGDRRAAYASVDKSLAIWPLSPYSLWLKADWLRQDGSLDEAQKLAEHALRLMPWLDGVWETLGDVRMLKKQYGDAAEAYRVAQRQRQGDARIAGKLAEALAATGDTRGARQLLAAQPEQATDANRSWVDVGLADAQLGRHGEAERAYRKALALDPANARAWYYLALTLVATGRVPEAEQALQESVRLKADLAGAWVKLAQIRAERNDLPGARQAFERATAAEPADANHWVIQGLVLKHAGDPRGALAALERAAQLGSSDANAWATLGELRIRNGSLQTGLAALQKALQLDPRHVNALLGMVIYHGGLGEQDKALAFSEQALAIDGTQAAAWSSKGYALLKLKRLPEATQAFETATRLDPDFANAWINLGEGYLYQRQLGKAITALERGIKLAPGATDARYYAAQAYAATAQLGKAREHLEVVLQHSPNMAPALYLLSGVNLGLHDQTALDASLRRLGEANPTMARKFRDEAMARGLPQGITLSN